MPDPVPTIGPCDAFGRRGWTNPTAIAVNRLAMRSALIPHPDDAGARGGHEARASSPWFASLDGTWRFHGLARPEEVTWEHVARGTPTGRWRTIEVPGHWTLQPAPAAGEHDGFDRPHYTNVQMPFAGVPPQVPDANPTGVYRTAFRVPTAWRGRRTILHVGSAETVLYVFCNGAPVGMSTDSRLAAEFDLTAHLRRGENELALVVVKWSAQSYVEDQDHWKMGGLPREVFLRSVAPVQLADLRIDAGLDDTVMTGDAHATGTLRVRATVGFDEADAPPSGWRVRAQLETLAGKRVGRALTGIVPVDVRPYLHTGHVVDVSVTYDGISPWSAEQPNRYRLVVSLVAPDGRVAEVVADTVGFRSVEIRDRNLLINGERVLIRGVNRHEHHPERGKAVTADDMRADLLTMKRHNVNAVRCSHYPNDPRFYDLCDELGFYVVDEANVESHAFNMLLCDDPDYRSTWLERGARMAQRDKNHPCIVLWSLGNESGYGANHEALAGWLRAYDASRPLHYEGAIMQTWARPGAKGGETVTDLVAPMYPALDTLAREVAASGAAGDGRPWILCEYSHAMGNSNGSLADYWALFETTPGLQGGFVWEWRDHGLRQQVVTATGATWRYAYGGQFGDEPNDANFVADGLCGPDGTPHPAMRELAWVHRPVAATLVSVRRDGDVQVRITNRQWFTDLSWLRGSWELLVDGAVARRGRLPAATGRGYGTATTVVVPCGAHDVPDGAEVHLTIRFHTARPTSWAPAGHEVAWDQLVLRDRPTRRPAASRDKTGTATGRGAPWVPSRGRLVARAEGRVGTLVASVDPSRGIVDRLALDGRPLLTDGVRPELWRAPLDNDGIKLWTDQQHKALGAWERWGLDRLRRRLVSIQPSGAGAHGDGAHGDGAALVTVHELTGKGAAAVHTQTTLLDGDGLVFTHQVDVPDEWDDLARVGVSFLLPAAFATVEWFGRGPGENEPDRKAGSLVGRYRRAPDELPYLMPQDFGTRCDVRWLALASRGARLVVEPIEPALVSFSATHHAQAALARAVDHTDLRRRDGLVVHVDIARRGVGTASCGPDTLDRFKVRGGRWTWSWRLRAERA